ncbi:MAG: hypothetical protein U0264_12665 [Candidatus Kapaibacterium sp.]
MMTITIHNPQNSNDLSVGNERIAQIADSIILSYGYYSVFDSLVINFTDKSSLLSIFTQNTTTYMFRYDFINSAFLRLFKEQEKMSKIVDSLIDKKDFKLLHATADSLSTIDGYGDLVLTCKINAILLENPDELIKFKELLLKEISIRPLSTLFNYFLGYIYFREKQYKLSATYLDNALRRNPNLIAANYFRGAIYVFSHDYSSGMKHYQRVKKRGSTMADKAIEILRKAGY